MSARKPSGKTPETRLKTALKEKTRELSLLHQISETISCNLNLDDVLKQIIGIVVQQTRADACLLYLIDEKKNELVLQASMNPHPKLIGRVRLELGEGITGWVAKERRPVLISRKAADDPRFRMFHNLPEDRYEALFSVPVVSKDQVIGVINIQHKKARRYSESETDLLMMIGQQVGGAIENARLVEQMKKQAGRIETLSRVSQTIASNRYLKEILELVVTMTAGMMNSKICSMMLLDEAKQELEIVATQSLSEAYRKKPNLKVGESISGRAVQEKKPISVLDVTLEPGYTYSELARKEGLRSMLSIPMMIRDRVVGVVNSYTSVEHKFDDEEV
ncbi:MAG TPA: GAF domain-containing protein, partial [Nitrospiria bacterium]